MQTRPSTVYVRKSCVKRRTLRFGVLFMVGFVLLLICGMSFVSALLLAGALACLIQLIIKGRSAR